MSSSNLNNAPLLTVTVNKTAIIKAAKAARFFLDWENFHAWASCHVAQTFTLLRSGVDNLIKYLITVCHSSLNGLVGWMGVQVPALSASVLDMCRLEDRIERSRQFIDTTVRTCCNNVHSQFLDIVGSSYTYIQGFAVDTRSSIYYWLAARWPKFPISIRITSVDERNLIFPRSVKLENDTPELFKTGAISSQPELNLKTFGLSCLTFSAVLCAGYYAYKATIGQFADFYSDKSYKRMAKDIYGFHDQISPFRLMVLKLINPWMKKFVDSKKVDMIHALVHRNVLDQPFQAKEFLCTEQEANRRVVSHLLTIAKDGKTGEETREVIEYDSDDDGNFTSQCVNKVVSPRQICEEIYYEEDREDMSDDDISLLPPGHYENLLRRDMVHCAVQVLLDCYPLLEVAVANRGENSLNADVLRRKASSVLHMLSIALKVGVGLREVFQALKIYQDQASLLTEAVVGLDDLRTRAGASRVYSNQ